MMDKSELIATLMAVQSGEMDIKKAAGILTAKKQRGRPATGMTVPRAELRIMITCAYVVIRPHVKNNDDAYRIISEAFFKSVSEVKKAVLHVTRYDHAPEVWFRQTAGGTEMLLADIATRNRLRWKWAQGEKMPDEGFRRLETVSTKPHARKFLTALRDLDT